MDGGLRPEDFHLSRELFLRALGATFLVAFASLAVQILGLVGSEGLLPAADFLARVHGDIGTGAYHRLPTLGWLGAGDTALRAMAWGGALLSVLVVVGMASAPTLLVLWALDLSLTVLGQDFLFFQWDMLLLETALLAVFYAPWTAAARQPRAPPPPTAARWLLWFLLFKLMTLSGLTKLLSGDPTWTDLTALHHHYETQPLPTWIGWHAHHLPEWFHRLSTLGMFGAELVVPVFIFLSPRARMRRTAAVALILFQVAIALTGNYGFFNLLTVVLCLSLLDDRFLARVLPGAVVGWLGGVRGRATAGSGQGAGAAAGGGVSAETSGEGGTVPPGYAWSPGRSRVHRWVLAGAVPVLFVLSCMAYVREVGWTGPESGLAWTNRVMAQVDPFRSVNGYGLFRVMTTERPEIVIEVSVDREEWQEVEFAWKPGDVTDRPRFVAPHMPRLDWQMWFAALGPGRADRWLLRLAEDVLWRTPEVEELLEEVPFEQGVRPGFVRMRLYRYRFSEPEEREGTGAWWSRELVRELMGPISLGEMLRR